MRRVFLDFVGNETGVTAIEYGLITAIVAAAVFSGVAALGDNFLGFLNHVGCMTSNQAACTLSYH